MSHKMFVIVIEAPYCDEIAQVANELGYGVIFLQSLDPNFYGTVGRPQPPNPQNFSKSLICDLTSSDELLKCIGPICQEFSVKGILGFHELIIENVALVSKYLALPFTNIEGIKKVRNKHAFRNLLYSKGLSGAQSFKVHDQQSINQGVRTFGFPCILKPISGTASLSVFVIRNELDLEDIWKRVELSTHSWPSQALGVTKREFLVENYLSGPLISIEVAVTRAKTEVITVGYRFRAEHDESIEIGTLMPVPLEESLFLRIKEFAKNIIALSGLDKGVFHLEAIVTENGIELVELNPRLMGGSLPQLFKRSYAMSIFHWLLPIYLDDKFPNIEHKLSKHSLSCFFGAFTEGRMPSADFRWLDEYSAFNPELKILLQANEPYRKLSSNYDYLGRFIINEENPDNLIELSSQIILRVENSLNIPLTRPNIGEQPWTSIRRIMTKI